MPAVTGAASANHAADLLWPFFAEVLPVQSKIEDEKCNGHARLVVFLCGVCV